MSVRIPVFLLICAAIFTLLFYVFSYNIFYYLMIGTWIVFAFTIIVVAFLKIILDIG